MKKERKAKNTLKLHKETLRLLNPSDLKEVAGGSITSRDSDFPNICQEWDSSGC